MTSQLPPPPPQQRRLSDWWRGVSRRGKFVVSLIGIIAVCLVVFTIYELARAGGCQEARRLDREASVGLSSADDAAALADDPGEEARWNVVAAAWTQVAIETIQDHRECFDELTRDMVLDGYQRWMQQRRAENPAMPSDLSEVADCLVSQEPGLAEQLDCVP